MLWDLPVTPPQGTRWFYVGGRYHFIQVFQVKLNNLVMAKFSCEDKILFYPGSIQDTFLCIFIYRVCGVAWRCGHCSSGWMWAEWPGCHSWQWPIFFCLLVHTDSQGPIQPSTHQLSPRGSIPSCNGLDIKLTSHLYIELNLTFRHRASCI